MLPMVVPPSCENAAWAEGRPEEEARTRGTHSQVSDVSDVVFAFWTNNAKKFSVKMLNG